jgi:DNA polymerase elongation subunit (family B)
MINNIVYGKNDLPNIVSVEINDNQAEIFQEINGVVTSTTVDQKFWMLSPKFYDEFKSLTGSQYYKYIKEFDTRDEYIDTRKKSYNYDMWSIYDPKESFLVRYGYTYFKNMKVQDVSVLAFDIETAGDDVIIISNTYRSQGKITRKMFCYDEYPSGKEMIDHWCNWVRKINPSVMCGHNIYGFDLIKLHEFANNNGTTLRLGRDGSDIKFNDRPSQFRKDGSQSYDYFNAWIYGREIIDTMFLAFKFDVARKYESYGLKKIIAQEGLEIEGRQHYDAATIHKNYTNPEEFSKIKDYAEQDGDDALALYDLMIPAFFYFNQHVPKSFQQMINSATGSQLNSILVRSYLQDNYSIPKADNIAGYQGAISIGIPNTYKNCLKFDVNSMYPSIMIQYQIYDPKKDPKKHLLLMLSYFTNERLKNKKLASTTQDRYFKDLEQSQKIACNSAYGALNANGLCFNYPKGASLITQIGRDILNKAINWSTNRDIEYWSSMNSEITDE